MNLAGSFPHQHKRCQWIGSGTEVNVETWEHQPTGSMIAVKIYKKPKKDFPREIEILKSLPHHDSVISILAYLPNSSTLHGDAAIFEYCPFRDLFELAQDLWQKTQGTFSEACVWSIFSQLSAGIAFIHEGVGCRDPNDGISWRPIIHRDLKVENVFVKSLGQKQDLSDINVKLGDFGLSTFYDPAKARMAGWFGTALLWPPEQTWEGREARPAGDVWATGCVIHELAHGFPPVVNPQITKALFKDTTGYPWSTWGESLQKQFWHAKSERKPLPINLGSHEYDARRRRPTPIYSDQLNRCMMAALEMNIEKRPTAGKLTAMVEQEHAAFLFHELKAEGDTPMAESKSHLGVKDEYDELL